MIGKAPSDFAIGDWGCTSITLHLVSKISESAILVTTTEDAPRVMLVRGIDTSKATDDIEFILQHPVVIEQTYSYTAVSGAQKTVLILDCNKRRSASPGPAEPVRKRATPLESLNQALKLEAKRLIELYPRYSDVSDKAVDRQFEFVKKVENGAAVLRALLSVATSIRQPFRVLSSWQDGGECGGVKEELG